MPYLDHVPSDHDFQARWIDAAKNPCERLARQWEVESKNKGRAADFVLPVAEAKARIVALFAAMDEMGKA